ncbi:DUF2306 domain-containing protein [Marinicella sediminis]|uniref:DUF2306 domain-containing protein n=1 Tax=Marinicella sediminis TaxID=1792834 RepID=A0ABV7JD58_9GAMM|nr:DUF2306 domain-containing protein [Marinicella sediminis]
MQKAVRLTGFGIYSLLCIGVAGYAFYFLQMPVNPHNDFQQKLLASGWEVPLHFYASGLALLLIPLQLSRLIRKRWLSFHRYLGVVYALAVLTGGVAGLVMAFNASGGWVARLGFTSLAVLWLGTTTLAVKCAIERNITRHQVWIYRSMALTSGAITLRLFLGLGLGVFQLPFLTVYVPTSWLSWMLNLAICEFILWQQRRSVVA